MYNPPSYYSSGANIHHSSLIPSTSCLPSPPTHPHHRGERGTMGPRTWNTHTHIYNTYYIYYLYYSICTWGLIQVSHRNQQVELAPLPCACHAQPSGLVSRRSSFSSAMGEESIESTWMYQGLVSG